MVIARYALPINVHDKMPANFVDILNATVWMKTQSIKK